MWIRSFDITKKSRGSEVEFLRCILYTVINNYMWKVILLLISHAIFYNPLSLGYTVSNGLS